MKRLIPFIILAALTALLVHVMTLRSVPKVIMTKAMTQMQSRGIPLHAFALSPRTSPQTQTVVRPSPDLAYSICLYDLGKAKEVHLRTGPWDKVASISFFDTQTNNFAAIRLSDIEDTRIILRPDGAQKSGGENKSVIFSPTQKGVILIRRLAPSPANYQRVEAVAALDECRAILKG